MRDNSWLDLRLNQIWQLLFPDIERKNNVLIRFKGKWKNKFGHIKKIKDSTEIAINSLFQNKLIPEYIIDITIAHELIHYMHGFNSPHPKLFKYPHQGNIVTRELHRRGFSHMIRKEKEFLKVWPELYKSLTKKADQKLLNQIIKSLEDIKDGRIEEWKN